MRAAPQSVYFAAVPNPQGSFDVVPVDSLGIRSGQVIWYDPNAGRNRATLAFTAQSIRQMSLGTSRLFVSEADAYEAVADYHRAAQRRAHKRLEELSQQVESHGSFAGRARRKAGELHRPDEP